MKYASYRYIYPPRPSNAIPQGDLSYYDDGNYIAQLKYNGSNTSIYTNGERVIVMNRHGDRLTRFEIKDSEILSIYKGDGGWSVYNGEYLNKSKRDEGGKLFNNKLIIFDILVNNGDYLIGKTLTQRMDILSDLFGENESDKEYLFGISENIYRVKSHKNNFSGLFDQYSKIDMIEGLVMKRVNSRLSVSGSSLNNSNWQLKCRKETLNYKF